MLNYRTPDDTLLAVRSLLSSNRRVDDLIVVDNDGTGAKRVLTGVSSAIEYVPLSSNLGFSGGMNVGIRLALTRGADRILLLNSDCLAPPDTLERLETVLDSDPTVGLVGPVVVARARPHVVTSRGLSYAPRSGRMREIGAGERLDPSRLHDVAVVDAVSGCAMLVRREVFDTIGLLDEDYFFGYEDLDFAWRARHAGFATVVAGRATVAHEGSRSIGATSSARWYFATRNHLLLAQRSQAPAIGGWSPLRACAIVCLNLAHAVRTPGAPLGSKLSAVWRGLRDYVRGRFGSPDAARDSRTHAVGGTRRTSHHAADGPDEHRSHPSEVANQVEDGKHQRRRVTEAPCRERTGQTTLENQRGHDCE